MTVPSSTFERREQGGGAVALVVVGHGAGPALLHRQARLGAVERLDLGLLVHRQHDGVLRRVDIQAHHVLDLLGKPRIVGQLEGRHQMRLQAMSLPDRLNARRRDAHRLGHGSQAPVGRVRRRLRLGLLDHPHDHIRRKRRLARWARLVAAQTVHPGLDIARPPASDGRLAHAQATLDLIGADTVAGQPYDPKRAGHVSAACCHWRSTPPAWSRSPGANWILTFLPAEQRVQRRLAAILAADVVGYSRMMREDETGTLEQLKTFRSELLDPKVGEYGGRVIKTTGDGSLIEFPSAIDAVQYAVDVQQATVHRNAAIPSNRQMNFRIGITSGT